ncbi:MAG: hypothetical protein IPP25_08465 [Saprospiraceae bacterium]|nr:hypothetical protein [Candidatus Opimibacter skivensis]
MKFTLIVILILSAMHAQSQQYAGEEKICCSGNGAAIGIDNPNPDHCYVWAAADGLTADQVNQKTPIVKPDKTTWYNVTVTDQFFSFKAIDRVRVVVYFGGIKFYPTYIYPNGEANQAKATLTENGYGSLPPEPFTWSVHADPDNTEATISQAGWISGCVRSGKVTIRATSTSNPECYDEEIIEVNIGVKDVIASDMVNEERKAQAGETLYIVKPLAGMHLVEFRAIPNDESTFPAGQPDWSGNPTAPPEAAESWTASLGPLAGYYTVTAGDKSVTVALSVSSPVTIQKALDLSQVKKFKEKFFNSYSFPLQSAYCTPIPIGLTIPADNITLGVALEEVNKYHNPNLGNKIDFAITLPAIGASGCLPLYNFLFIASVPGLADVYVFPYVRAAAGITIVGNVTRDPSMQMSDWDGTLNVVGKVELFAGFAVDAAFGPFNLSVSGETGSDLTMKARLQEGKIETNASVGGLQVKFAGYVYVGSPSNPTFSTPTFELGPYKVIDGYESPYVEFIDLNVD